MTKWYSGLVSSENLREIIPFAFFFASKKCLHFLVEAMGRFFFSFQAFSNCQSPWKNRVFHSGFRKKSQVRKCRPSLLGHKWGIIVPGVPSEERRNWGWELRQQNAVNFVWKKPLERIRPYSLISRTKMSRVFGTGRPTIFYGLKPAKLAKFILVVMNSSDVEKTEKSSWTELRRWRKEKKKGN